MGKRVPFLKKVSKAIKGVKGGASKKRSAIFGHILKKFKTGNLHRRGAGKKTGPAVKDRRMALAIAYNSARRLGFASMEDVHIPTDMTPAKKRLRTIYIKKYLDMKKRQHNNMMMGRTVS